MCRSTHYHSWSEYKMRNNKLLKLEDIPEDTELYSDSDDADDDADANAEFTRELEEARNQLETDLEVLRKAMDMGIWVLSLGFGYILSRASITNFRPSPTFF